MSKKTILLIWLATLFYTLFNLLVVGCALASPEATLIPPATALATLEPITRATSIASPSPSFTVTPQIAPFPWIAITLPEELDLIFDTNRCERPCFHNIMLGQTIEEALSAIRNDPKVNTNHIYTNGDYVNISSDEQLGLTVVEWYWQGAEDYPLSARGFVGAQNNIVVFIVVDLNTAVPLSMVLEKFGQPVYVLTEYYSPSEIVFQLEYPDLGLSFPVENLGKPASLHAFNVVERISISEPGIDLDVCRSSVFKGLGQAWKGFGGINVYYDDHGNLLDTVPLDCPPSESN